MGNKVDNLSIKNIQFTANGKQIVSKVTISGLWVGDVPDHRSNETRTDLDDVVIRMAVEAADGPVFNSQACSCKINHNTGTTTIVATLKTKLKGLKGEALEMARKSAVAEWTALSLLACSQELDREDTAIEILLTWGDD